MSDHADLKPFPCVISLPVLWGDMDAFGHVNNVRPIRWFECSRVKFMEDAGMAEMMKAEKYGPILASVTCDYKRQIKYPDNVHIGARVSRLGRSSMTIDHRIVSDHHDGIAAEGKSVVVIFDYQTQRPVRIPAEFRATLEQMQGEIKDS